MAQIDIRDIDERIQKLQELRKVMSDPEMAALLNQLLASKNGNAIMPTASVHKAKKKGDFIKQIARICEYFAMEPFKISDVIKAFESAGHTFKAQDKNVATYSALKRLVKRGMLKIIVQGKGAKPSVYQMNATIPK
jgi:hypothetical protein